MFSYQFPAVRGVQANQEYYISMVPYSLLEKLFPSEEDYVLPEYRAQRRINEIRIPEIKNYIVRNRDSYVFSALSASIDGEFEFIPLSESSVGILNIDMSSTFLINDGQHRKAAILEALNEDPSLRNETISIVFFRDKGLQKSQQMFTDLNKHAVKTSNSLSTLYDSRDELAIASKKVIDTIPFFRKFTDKERDILGKNSSNFFTLSNFYKANQKLLHSKVCSEDDLSFLIQYWSLVAENIIEWNEVLNAQITKKELREKYIVTLAVVLNALGRLGRYYYDHKDVGMEESLKGLQKIDWSRQNLNDWLYRTLRENGKVMNTEEAVLLTCSRIKTLIGIELSPEELLKEKTIVGNL